MAEVKTILYPSHPFKVSDELLERVRAELHCEGVIIVAYRDMQGTAVGTQIDNSTNIKDAHINMYGALRQSMSGMAKEIENHYGSAAMSKIDAALDAVRAEDMGGRG